MTGDEATIRTSIEGAVGTIVIDNPRRRNAMTLDMYASIPPAVDRLTGRPGLRVVVLRGRGDDAFGAGSDISEFRELRTGDRAERYNAIEAAAAHTLAAIPVPVIACIHGSCMGGGVGLALCADLRYAADDARFALTPAKLGVGFPPDAMARLVAVVGAARAKELVFTARVIDAHEAARIGLVHAVVAKADLDEHVAEVAASIARLAPLTLRAAKLTVDDPGGPATRDAIAGCFRSDDYAEGIRAYLERRSPRFTGT
jgi:enoyl-CoA hydratase